MQPTDRSHTPFLAVRRSPAFPHPSGPARCARLRICQTNSFRQNLCHFWKRPYRKYSAANHPRDSSPLDQSPIHAAGAATIGKWKLVPGNVIATVLLVVVQNLLGRLVNPGAGAVDALRHLLGVFSLCLPGGNKLFPLRAATR